MNKCICVYIYIFIHTSAHITNLHCLVAWSPCILSYPGVRAVLGGGCLIFNTSSARIVWVRPPPLRWAMGANAHIVRGGEPPPEPFWLLFRAKAPRKQPVCPYLSLIYPGPCTLVDRLFFFCQSRSNRLKILKTNVRVGG